MLVIVLLVKFLYFRGQEHLQRLQGYQTQKFTQTKVEFQKKNLTKFNQLVIILKNKSLLFFEFFCFFN